MDMHPEIQPEMQPEIQTFDDFLTCIDWALHSGTVCIEKDIEKLK